MIKFWYAKSFAITIVLAFLLEESLNGQDILMSGCYPIIPYPSHLIAASGAFTIDSNTKIILQNDDFENESDQLVDVIKSISAISLKRGSLVEKNCIVLKKDKNIVSDEGYNLLINTEQITLSASGPAGIFWGIQTIRQMVSLVEKARDMSKLTILAAEIKDSPAFPWRGMHLDVARHFFSVGYMKKFIDRMAMYKLNKLHLHLTDDQGWRIEIKKYPLLTQRGAWRTFNADDSDCIKRSETNPDFIIDTQHIIYTDNKTLYGGYYTQADMREIIAFAASKHIDIIPEIDMPGHMMAAIQSYPFLATEAKSKNDFSTPICPCRESTFEFAENVFKEIIELFPFPYVHIGGDEVSKIGWSKSAECRELMKREGLKDVNELQAYFIGRMQKYFEENGKKLIGWDDILEGPIDSTAILNFWRAWVPDIPKKAAKNGNSFIVSPINPLYFDMLQDRSTLYNLYHFNPMPPELLPSDKKKVIGAQANVWTESIPSEKRADFMTMPRMTALSEMVWTNRKDYDGYLERLTTHYVRWDKMKVHYRLPDLEGFAENNVFTDSTKLIIEKPLPNLVVHYTIDGSVPDLNSPVLPEPLSINTSVNIKLVAYTLEGNRSETYDLRYEKVPFMPPVLGRKTLKKGVKCMYHKGSFRTMKKMARSTATKTYILDSIYVPEDIQASTFGLQYMSYINIPETGIYNFFLTSDHGSVLIIDNKTIIDNDGIHSALQKSGGAALQKGLHALLLNYNERGGIYYSLRLQYSIQGGKPEDISPGMFSHQKNN